MARFATLAMGSMLIGWFGGQTLVAQGQAIRTEPERIAQIPSPLAIEVIPALGLPVAESASDFSLGGGTDAGISYRLPGSAFALGAGVEYAYVPDKASQTLSLAAGRAGVSWAVPIGGGISGIVSGNGGYYYATYNDFSLASSNPFVGAGLGLSFPLAGNVRLKVGANYSYFMGLYEGVSAGIGLSIPLGNLGGSVDIPTTRLRPAFPVFYKYYDDHPIGTLQLKSNLKVPASGIKVQVFIKEYMDAAKTVEVPGVLKPGEKMDVDLYALFNDRVLGITEGTKVATEIIVSYTVEGQSYQDRQVQTLALVGRNAMTWDDNRKAAAYVTSKDPEVLNFARSVSSYIRSKETRSICDNLETAIAFHEALNLYGINYTPNPKTPYEVASTQKDALDFLQFPRETFEYKAGDCSDLSILYSALFQAVGIDDAFITIPGHIFIAVDTNLSPEQAPKELIPEGQFIVYNNKAWIPIEITAIHSGFMSAWKLGAKEWAENTSAGTAGFYPVSEAWKAYQPVGLPGAERPIQLPQSDQILRAYLTEVQKYLDSALTPQVARYQSQIRSSGSVAAMNGLGILYAKYGQNDKAESEFKLALSKKPYLPAILNLGHLYFSRGDWKHALDYYRQARDLDPGNSHTLLALARVNQELQNYDEAKKAYDKLKSENPSLAAQYAFLGESGEGGTRAADIAGERGSVLWEGE